LTNFKAILALSWCAAALLAQSDANKGQIIGTVFDPGSAVVPQATVKIRSVEEGATRELITNDEGQFRAVQLTPGRYEVTVEKSGFAPAAFTDVVVNVGSTVEINARLQVGSTTVTVDVGDTLLNVSLPMPSTVLNEQAITNLPILGRRFHDFATLTPTVQVDPQRGQLSFVGQRGINANVMLDGTDYNQPFFGGIRGGERSNSAFTVPQGAIQEFQTVTAGYAAEYGRSTGGILNAITKSGSNSIHGDAFYQLRHKEMGLKNPVLGITPNETLQQFGGNAGGPIHRDRWFWFGAIEQQYTRVPRQVFFSALRTVTPSAATREAYDYFLGEERPFKQTNDATAVTGRTDYQFEAGHRLTARYNFSRNDAENAGSQGGALNPLSRDALSNEALEKDRTHTGTVQHTHLFSPTLINDTRFAVTFELRPRDATSALPTVTAGSGTLVGAFGARSFLPSTQDDTRIQVADSLSLTRGTHTIKLGLDYNRLDTFQAFGFNQFGAFTVSGSNAATVLDVLGTGGNIPDRFDSPDVIYNRQIGNLLAEFGMHQFALFAQDSWRATPKLTLDLGFRWEGQWNPEPEATNTDLVGRLQGVRFPNGATLDPTRIPDSLKQFMPRFGFAWTPITEGWRTVIRGHAGVFYASTPMLIFAGHTNNFRTVPGNLSIQLRPQGASSVYDQLLAVGLDLNRSPLDNLPVIPVETVQRAASLAAGGRTLDPFAGVGVDVIATDFTNPRSYQAGIGVESELTSNFVAGIQFNWVNTVNLHRNVDYNLPAPIIRPNDRAQRPFFGLRSTGVRPIPSLGGFTVRESSARSMFRGGTFSAQYRKQRFQFGAFYTLSESFSDADSERDSGGVEFDNNFDFRRDYNYARLDVRHQFAANGLVSLPFDLEVSGIFRARSGYPLNPTTGADTNEDLFTTDRPYSAPGLPMERNAFRNRGIATTDVRIMKNFRFGEIRRVQFSAEIFNLFNADNVVFNSATGGGTVTTFGLGIDPATGNPAPIDSRFQRLLTPTGAYDPLTTVQAAGVNPLQLQFGLRFFF
jgi:hypothetical protein